ncbi:MAG: MupA/Atu3671 family FMN-dependent luciferase-like monooxygenase, partial [Pseudomonadota bacterium]
DDREVIRWAEGQDLPVRPVAQFISEPLAANSVDWLFSVANLDVLPTGVIHAPREGAVNFHDGPLPAYCGLNTPVWALVAGEETYAVTWHSMTDAVDSGSVIVDIGFPLAPDETALSLNARCLEAGVQGFEKLIAKIEGKCLQPLPQPAGERRLYRRDALPAGSGRLDFTKGSASVARLVRALDHGPYFNPVTTPKIEIDETVVCIRHAGRGERSGPAGTVLALSHDRIEVACGDGSVWLDGLTRMDGTPFDLTAVKTGGRLGMPTQAQGAAIDRAMSIAKRGDAVWRPALKTLSPIVLAQALPRTRDPAWSVISLNCAAPSRSVAALALGMMAHNLSSMPVLDIAVHRAPPAGTRQGYVSEWVPLRHDFDARDRIGDQITELEARFQTQDEYPFFCADLPIRDPDLRQLRTPDLAISLDSDAPVADSALTLALCEGEARVHHDANRIAPDLAEILAARLAHLIDEVATADHDRALSDIPPMPATERAFLLAGLNATDKPFDASATIHGLFEAQVALNPDRPAIAHQGGFLTYGELNARANRVARRLRDMGLGQGDLVGLAVHRSPQMLVGALAILKAGGAYLPLDPAYPRERIQQYLTESAAPFLVTEGALAPEYATDTVQALLIDQDSEISTLSPENIGIEVAGDDLAYVIFTSGSTGRPKGVMIPHRNVANFFSAMDDVVEPTEVKTWLALTSLSFDISVLELFWTLANGFKVVLHESGAESLAPAAQGQPESEVDLSLFFWGQSSSDAGGSYDLLLESAQFADKHGFKAIWLPERHFHSFGGMYPNPSVTAAAVSVLTETIELRAGSCVAPLHHPARIAEEWAVVDNLSRGRTGLALASGWQQNDFILRPENRPPANKPALFETVDTLRRLWRGEEVEFELSGDKTTKVITQPRPVTKELPLWLTTAGNPETWRKAGEMGMNILTHLLGQTVPEIEEKIALYHQALRDAGHDPQDFRVTLMLHSFIGSDRAHAMAVAREPMMAYLRSSIDLVKEHAGSFPAFKRRADLESTVEVDFDALSEQEMQDLLEHAYRRYFDQSGLFGSVEDGMARVRQLSKIGVSEIACLVDIGIAAEDVRDGLPRLAEVLKRTRTDHARDDLDHSIASEVIRHGVTHLQCTPSHMRLITASEPACAALRQVKHVLLGGEPLSEGLASQVAGATGARITNLYGPTETTIWSMTSEVAPDQPITIGRPIANTRIYVLDANGEPVPVGTPGEIWIGGEGVAKGYLSGDPAAHRRFIDNPFGPGRIYQTGDLGRWRADRTLDFIGRNDQQIKLRGYRIELGEIEAVARAHAMVRQAVARLDESTAADPQIVLFTVLSHGLSAAELRAHIAAHLPDHMVPASMVVLDEMPLTPNGKIDRAALVFDADMTERQVDTALVEPLPGTQTLIAEVWQQLLKVPKVGAKDDFFELGGDSLSALEASCMISDRLTGQDISMTKIFQFPVLADLAACIDESDDEIAELAHHLGLPPAQRWAV